MQVFSFLFNKMDATLSLSGLELRPLYSLVTELLYILIYFYCKVVTFASGPYTFYI